ncbi:MAG: hypothetical protein ACOCUV_00450 [bacterium]
MKYEKLRVMKIIDIALVLVTTFCLTANQVLLKIWMEKNGSKILPLGFDKFSLLFKPELLFSVIAFIVAIVIWLFLLQRIQFSLLYPLISFSYVFGLFAAKYVFNEQVPTVRWVGVFVILIGVFLVTREH